MAQEGLGALADHAHRGALDQDDAARLAPIEPDHREHARRAPQRGAQHRVAVGQARELPDEIGVEPGDQLGEARRARGDRARA